MLLPLLSVTLSSCAKKIDYYSYVSELRHDVYMCEEDSFELKIYITDRESPYNSDGIKGEMQQVAEIYYTPDITPDEVCVSVGGYSGEMNYVATTRSFYLSFSSDGFDGDELEVAIEEDGSTRTVNVINVKEDGVIDAKTALECAVEYDGKTFKGLENGSAFMGEIYVRLIYDAGCYYYVGVCDRDGNVCAYLVDGLSGRIIAEKK